MERDTFELLMRIGVPCNMKGFDYIGRCVDKMKELVKSGESCRSFCKVMYDGMANEKDTSSQIERCMRTAKDAVFYNGNRDELVKVFYGHIPDRIPGTKKFVLTLASYLVYNGGDKRE